MKIKVYQIDSEKDNRRLAFMDSEFAEKHGGIRPSDYKCVFDGYIDAVNLEQVFQKLNSPERPGTYRGHSLSVSDIVEVTGDVQPNWDAFAATSLGRAYFAARLAVANAFSVMLNKDMDFFPSYMTDPLSDNAYVERQFLTTMVNGNSPPSDEDIKPFLLPLIEQYASRTNSNICKQYGWTHDNVKTAIARQIESDSLRESAEDELTTEDSVRNSEADEICREVFAVSHSKDLAGISTLKYIPCQSTGAFFCDSFGFKKIEFDGTQATPLQGIRCLEIQPGKPPFEIRIPDELRCWQMAVSDHCEDSLMEVTYPFDDNAVVIGNEEAKLNGMAGNRRLYGSIYAGPIFIVGDNNGEFCDLTDKQIKEYGEQFAEPEDISPEEVQNDCGFFITGF